MANSLKVPTRDVVDERRQRFSARYINQDQAAGYNVGTYEYPDDLRARPDTQHYVAFYVLVREKSQLGQEAIARKRVIEQGSASDVSRGLRFSDETRLDLTDGKALDFITKNAGTLAGVGYILKNVTNPKQWIGGAAVGLGTQAAVGLGSKILENAGVGELFDAGSTVRLKDVITLHMEERPSVRYSVNYNTKDLGVITGALVQGSAAGLNAGKEFLGEGFARAIAELIKLPGIIGSSTLADVRELTTSTKTNPFRQVMFESVDYRTFNFRYNFFPKSIKESNDVKSIIELFKQHMHPELSANKFFHTYPSEFEIRYMYKTKENPYIHKIAKCALTDLQVDYGGDQFSTFENGAPVQIGLTLTFRELEQLSSQRISGNGF
jgi:hypothetical protein